MRIPLVGNRRWRLKQRAARPGRYYGDGGTIHASTALDVETTQDGRVVAVWFRCQMLPFEQVAVEGARASEMISAYSGAEVPVLTGVEVQDR